MISPSVVHYLLALPPSREPLFFRVDGDENCPSDVYAYCLTNSQEGEGIDVQALRYSLDRRPGHSSVCEFRIEKIHLNSPIDIAKPIKFLRFLKTNAYQAYDRGTGSIRPQDHHTTSHGKKMLVPPR